jgi:ATP-dependent protease ClpP protease subunit
MPTIPAAKTKAEIEMIQAQRDFHLANARVADVLEAQERISLRLRQRTEAKELARDEFHKVYIFDENVTDDSVKDCIRQLTTWSRQDPGCDIEIQVNTSGGSIFAGFALVDFIRGLRNSGHEVTAVVYGMAASMGGVLLQAADKRIMGENAFMLIHEGSMFTGGDFGNLEDDMKLYGKLHDRILSLLTSRSKVSPADVKKAWKRTNWWLDAAECLDRGFIDEVC